MAEYSLLLTFFAIPTILGFYAAGAWLIKDYAILRDHILTMYP